MCICSLIENVKSPKFIQKIFEEINNKILAVRIRCAIYVDLMLKNYPNNILEKNTSVFEQMIEKLISDANKETRNGARQAFYEYQSLFPNKAAKLYSKLDNATQKAVNDDKMVKERPKSNNIQFNSNLQTKKEEENGNFPIESLSKTSGFVQKNKTSEKKLQKEQETKKNNHKTANSSSNINGDDDTSLYSKGGMDLEDEELNIKTMKSEKILDKRNIISSNPKSNIVNNMNNTVNLNNLNNNTLNLNNNTLNSNNNMINNMNNTMNNNISNSMNNTMNNQKKIKTSYQEMNQRKFDVTNEDEEVVIEQKKNVVYYQDAKKKILSNLNEKQKSESFHVIKKEEIIMEKNVKEYKKKEEIRNNNDNLQDILAIKEEELDSLLEKADNTVFFKLSFLCKKHVFFCRIGL